jgi:hypothetical protein
LIFYHWLSAKIDRIVHEMDLMTLEFVESYALPSAAAPRVRNRIEESDNGAATEPAVAAAHE